MDVKKPSFDLYTNATAMYEAQRLDTVLDANRCALNAMAHWLELPTPLPNAVEATIYFAPATAGKELAQPLPAPKQPDAANKDISKAAEDTPLRLQIWVDSLDQTTLTHRTAEALHTHPLLNSQMTRQLQPMPTCYSPRSLMRSGIASYMLGASTLPFSEHFIHNGRAADTALMAGGAILTAWGAYKKLTALSPASTGGTWRYFIDDIAPPIRVIPHASQ